MPRRTGAYARALAEMIQAPGLPLGSLFTRVRLRVDELTDGAAVPWASGAFGDATLYPGTASSAPLAGPAPAPGPDGTPSAAYSALIASDTLADDLSFLTLFPLDALTPHVRLMAARRREAMIWSDSVKADNPRAFWDLHGGAIRADRISRMPGAGLVRLHAPLEPPPRFDIVAFDDVVPPPAGEAALLDASSDPKGSVAIPPPPVSLVPPQRNAFADELAPPLLVPAGVLPIPMPVPLPNGAGAVRRRWRQSSNRASRCSGRSWRRLPSNRPAPR